MKNIKRLTDALKRQSIPYLLEEPMSKHTSFAIGGGAAVFIEPRNIKEAIAVRSLCHKMQVSSCVIGNGTNLLVSDSGLDGVVLAFGAGMNKITRQGNTITAESGAALSMLCRFAQKEGLSGLEFAYGIPGSVGGAVFMNAGAYGGEIDDVVTLIEAVDPESNLVVIPVNEAGLDYRTSRFMQGDWLISSATFTLMPENPEVIDSRMSVIMDKRRDSQPLEYPSAGSTFKRPKGGFASELIDRCGLKGYTIGGAQVSEKHAGFVINKDGATCEDVLELCQHIIDTVQDHTGFLLEMEVKRLGDSIK